MNPLMQYFGDHRTRMQLAGSVLVVLFVLFSLVLDKVASTVFAIFFLAGLWLLIRRRHEKADVLTRWVLFAFAAYFLVSVASFFLGEQTRLGEKILGRDIRFLGAAAVCFTLLALRFPERVLRHSLAAGGLVTGIFAVIEVLLSEKTGYRAGGRTVSIVFGHLSACLFAVNFALVLFERRGRALSAAGALAATVAVFLSGTRGALLSVAIVVIVGALVFYLRNGWQVRRRSLAIATVVSLAIVIAGGNGLLPRIELGWQQYSAYRYALPLADAPGCVNAELLDVLLEHGRAYGGMRAERVNASESLPAACDGSAMLRVVNDSDRRARWRSAYRNVPVGAPGRLMVRGTATLQLEDHDARIDIATGNDVEPVDIPAAGRLDRTRFLLTLEPGEELLFRPVGLIAGEYAFAATDSSIGNRIDMWTATWRQTDFSLLGQGTGSWPLAMAREAQAGAVPWRLAAYDHGHSDYLNILLERGWLGLFTLLAVLSAPLAGARRTSGWRGPALILLVSSVAVSALTETVFNHSIGITYYCVLVLLLLNAAPRRDANRATFQ